jgi:hypothetical protein
MRRLLLATMATGMLALGACTDNDTTVETATVDTTSAMAPAPVPTVTNSSTTVVHDTAAPSETTVSTAVDTDGTATVSTTTK